MAYSTKKKWYKNWKVWAWYLAGAAVIYGAIYLIFFHHWNGGGGGY